MGGSPNRIRRTRQPLSSCLGADQRRHRRPDHPSDGPARISGSIISTIRRMTTRRSRPGGLIERDPDRAADVADDQPDRQRHHQASSTSSRSARSPNLSTPLPADQFGRSLTCRSTLFIPSRHGFARVSVPDRRDHGPDGDPGDRGSATSRPAAGVTNTTVSKASQALPGELERAERDEAPRSSAGQPTPWRSTPRGASRRASPFAKGLGNPIRPSNNPIYYGTHHGRPERLCRQRQHRRDPDRHRRQHRPHRRRSQRPVLADLARSRRRFSRA